MFYPPVYNQERAYELTEHYVSKSLEDLKENKSDIEENFEYSKFCYNNYKSLHELYSSRGSDPELIKVCAATRDYYELYTEQLKYLVEFIHNIFKIKDNPENIEKVKPLIWENIQQMNEIESRIKDLKAKYGNYVSI